MQADDAHDIDIPQGGCGFIDQQLKHAVDGGIAAAEAQVAICEDQEFEDADTLEEIPAERDATGRAKGGIKFKPTSKHFLSPKIRARKKAFLTGMRQSGVVRLAAQVAGISVATAYCYREWDPQFATDWKLAEEEAIDLIEARATQLATEGYLEPVYSAGILVGRVRKFESKLMMFMLERRRRSIYGQRVGLEHSGAIAGGGQATEAEAQAMVKALLPTLLGQVQAAEKPALPGKGEA